MNLLEQMAMFGLMSPQQRGHTGDGTSRESVLEIFKRWEKNDANLSAGGHRHLVTRLVTSTMDPVSAAAGMCTAAPGQLRPIQLAELQVYTC